MASGRMKAEINVTPLVDIVLVLLIIFIVITPAVNDAVRLPVAKHSVKPEGEPGAKPLGLLLKAARDPATGRVLGPGPVLVEDASSVFSLGDEGGRRQLRAFIARVVEEKGDKRVSVKADADLPFKYVNELFLVCREGGAGEASIVTAEDKRGEN